MLGSYAFLPSSGVEEVFVVLDAAVVWICNPVLKWVQAYILSKSRFLAYCISYNFELKIMIITEVKTAARLNISMLY